MRFCRKKKIDSARVDVPPHAKATLEFKQMLCCSVDLLKAFDCMDRICLFTRLLEISITGKLFSASKPWHDHTRCRVRFHDYVSESFDNNIGVTQGGTLSPTPFMLFISNLVEEMKWSGIGLQMKLCFWLRLNQICKTSLQF